MRPADSSVCGLKQCISLNLATLTDSVFFFFFLRQGAGGGGGGYEALFANEPSAEVQNKAKASRQAFFFSLRTHSSIAVFPLFLKKKYRKKKMQDVRAVV